MKRIWVLETDGEGTCGIKMTRLQFLGIICTVTLFTVYTTTNYQFLQTKIEEKSNPFFTPVGIGVSFNSLDGLPRGIIQATSDLELKPLWSKNDSKSKVNVPKSRNLLAIPVGIKQKTNVDAIVQKFLADRFTIMLLHYDANVDGWLDLEWSKKAIHIVAPNQTKWWFAKRFLHPDVVSIYDYIFLWDEDLGVENFHPGRYLKIVKSERLEISQPALDPNSTGIHHKITVRKKGKKFHTRILDAKGRSNCSEDSEGPPCTGYVEGMAPVFSRSAWPCVWHLIQNDLVHGWGMDMKLGYCAQGGRIENIGVVDSEYVLHQGIKSLGGAAAETPSNPEMSTQKPTVDVRTEVRRECTLELRKFRERWDQAVKEDRNWVDPFRRKRPNR
ncbi:uncharacterized protein LOC131312769 isoform X3 [Rhododendron vialii]|uniref:uncharacterized protein LOC131312769 isoform X3 n=1 Tax=Rhododendron vialii TaxID=182163 RepID=UPI00265E5455|nr:uncharacterized protein LOC131312769 isoform X3 [Rhododendron vialii]XP_058196717.1 uncharacterized protein LOC131312769 isoform X3 [Rhododendron vialii]